MEWLNYHHLFYFHTIAKEGSIVKASRRLSLGQPTLSTQLKQFENALGHSLFERSNRQLKLTETGRVVLEYANEIFKMGREMVEVVNDRLSPDKIHLQVGALDSVPKHAVHHLVTEALKLGNCYVTVLEGSAEFLLRELRAHQLDLVLTNSPAPIAPAAQCYSRKIVEMPVLICAGPKFQKLRSNFPQSLNGQPFILPTTQSRLRSDIEHYFETKNIVPLIIAECEDTLVQKLLAFSGHGVIAIALPAVSNHLRKGELVKLGELREVTEQFWLTSAARKIQNPIASKLMKTFTIDT